MARARLANPRILKTAVAITAGGDSSFRRAHRLRHICSTSRRVRRVVALHAVHALVHQALKGAGKVLLAGQRHARMGQNRPSPGGADGRGHLPGGPEAGGA